MDGKIHAIVEAAVIGIAAIGFAGPAGRHKSLL
jgi:hypothetical protein